MNKGGVVELFARSISQPLECTCTIFIDTLVEQYSIGVTDANGEQLIMNDDNSAFIKYVEDLIDGNHYEMSENVRLYWEAFKGKVEEDKPLFTDNGKLILQYLKDNQSTPTWKAKEIAEGLFISSRAVSGAIRKLVTDGYVEKMGQDPVIYSLTENGKNIVID